MSEFDVFSSREKGGWAEAAKFANYIDMFGPVSASFATRLIALANVENLDVLDLCCGDARSDGCGSSG